MHTYYWSALERFLGPIKSKNNIPSVFWNSMVPLFAAFKLTCPSRRLWKVGLHESSKSAMNTSDPLFNALMIIFRSTGPVISTWRHWTSSGTGATRQLSSWSPFANYDGNKMVIYQKFVWWKKLHPLLSSCYSPSFSPVNKTKNSCSYLCSLKGVENPTYAVILTTGSRKK